MIYYFMIFFISSHKELYIWHLKAVIASPSELQTCNLTS